MVAYDIQTVTENFYAEGVLIHNCYVAHGTRGYRATGLPTVDPAYPDKMRKNMQKVMVSGAGYMTSFTEPFQRLEGTYHITQRLTQMFMDEGLPFFYCTRLLPPDWAIEALTQNPYNYIQWSVNTSNQDLYKRLSPGAARLEDILTTASELNGYGVYTSFQVNPVLAGIVTLEELLILVDLAAEAKVNHLIFKFAEQVYSNRGLLMDRMHSTRLPEGRVAEFDRLLNQTIGGVYTIQQDVRLEWLDELLKRTRERGVTMSTCYEYYDDGHAGANYGPYILTSRGGCHGQSIPMYFRPESGAPFEPLPGCFESGCLYCEEYGTAVCGNALMLSATKLEFKDLRSVQLKGEDINWHLPGSAPSPDYVAEYDNWYPGKKTFAEYYDMRP
jgi:DNA repair photolyase